MDRSFRILFYVVALLLLTSLVRASNAEDGATPGTGVKGLDEGATSPVHSSNQSNENTEHHEGTPVECVREGSEMICDGEIFVHEEARIKPGSPQFALYIVLALTFVCTAGMVSGLQLGLLSLDHNNLQILINAGEPHEQRNAKRILPLVRRHHLLLVTLLVINAACMESLPIFLDRLMSPVAAIIVSVTLVLLFGEIIPQAVCSRFGLRIGSLLSPVVWCLIGVTFVISYPIAKLLDCILGESHGGYYRRGELKELLKLQQDAHSLPLEQRLTPDESRIMHAAIDLKEKTAGQHMTPLSEVFMLDFDGVIDADVLHSINRLGHSRIPVYRKNRNDIMGMVLTKELIMVNPDKTTPVTDVEVHRMPTVDSKMPLYEVLAVFQRSRAHMAVVLSDQDHITNLGVLTLEDVIEELLGVELEDEFDRNGRMAGIVSRANSAATSRDRKPADLSGDDYESGGTALLSAV